MVDSASRDDQSFFPLRKLLDGLVDLGQGSAFFFGLALTFSRLRLRRLRRLRDERLDFFVLEDE